MIKNSGKFAELDLSKNCFTGESMKLLAPTLELHNTSLVHLSLGGNSIQTDGAIHLFRCLQGHESLVSLNLANTDCYKNKIKIGTKGAEELSALLSHPMCLISNLDLTDNSLTVDGLHHVI